MHKCSICGETNPERFHKAGMRNGEQRLHANCKDCRKQMTKSSRQSKTDTCSCGAKKYLTSKVCRNCNYTTKGPGSNSWRRVEGKVKTNKKGYLMEVCSDHPAADRGGYVLQHRLIMEKMLDRPLLFTESVHHKNGVRTDNSPENLELWVTFQPSGQRPDDLLKWADEIISRYRNAGVV